MKTDIEREAVLTVVVGSRLHGLHTEQSDIDRRGIYKIPLLYIISPYRDASTTHWVEGEKEQDADDTSYEIRHFCKLASQCNPSVLEVLWSNIVIGTTPLGEELRANRSRFLDSKRIHDSHKGYAANQLKKMYLFEPNPTRTPKAAVAYIRVLQQAVELLATGDFSPQVAKDRDFLMEVKYNFSVDLIPELSRRFAALQAELELVYKNNEGRFHSNIEWVENFLLRAYTE